LEEKQIEMRIVEYILELRKERDYSKEGIATLLNSKEIPYRNGKEWKKGTVRDILKRQEIRDLLISNV